MSPEAIARIVAAAHEYLRARDNCDAPTGSPIEAAIRLDDAYRELRASCGYEVEQ